jgi:hypothetical protein
MNFKLLSTEIGEKVDVPVTALTLTWCHAETETAAVADPMAVEAAAGACQALSNTRPRSALSLRICRTCRPSVSSRVRQPSTETDTTTDQVGHRFPFLLSFSFYERNSYSMSCVDNVFTMMTDELMGLNC